MAVGYAYLRFGALSDRLAAIPLLLLGISMNFADVDAVVSADDRLIMLVPQAISRSIRTTWTGTTMLRAIALVGTPILVDMAASGLQKPLQALHLPNADFWATTPLDVLAFVPVAVITVHVYLDAIGYEAKRPCGE